MATVEEIIKELFDNFKYPAIQNVWNNFKQFEQKEIITYLSDVLAEEFQEGYKEREEEGESVFDEGYENGYEDGITYANKVVKQKLSTINMLYFTNNDLNDLYMEIRDKLYEDRVN